MTDPIETNISEVFTGLRSEWDTLTQQMHVEHALEFGVFEFLSEDVMENALANLARTAHICMLQYMKLRLIQLNLADEFTQVDKMGNEAFTPNGH